MASAESKRVLEMLRGAPRPGPEVPVAKRRETMEKFARPLAPDCSETPIDAGGVPAAWIDAPGAGGSVLVHLHGGGYVTGSIVTHREVCGRFSRASGARALLLDYRLGPEAPFPAAVDDAVAAYRWLLEQGTAPARIAVSGDSAGGGLVVALLLALKERGLPQPAAGVCISPWVDLTGSGDSMTSRAALDPTVARDGLSVMAAQYLGGASATNPLASPLFGDLSGLPPLLIQVGSLETLFDDATRLDACARTAGVEVRFEAWDDQVHVWHMFAGMLPEGREAIEHAGAFVRERTGNA